MTKRTYGHTKSGTPITHDLIEELADEAERATTSTMGAASGDGRLARAPGPRCPITVVPT